MRFSYDLLGSLFWLVGPLVFSPLTLAITTPMTVGICVNLNTASLKQLESLPGIGPVLAKRILAFRFRHGRFHRKHELLNIKGIGLKKYNRLKHQVCLESHANPPPPKPGERRSR